MYSHCFSFFPHPHHHHYLKILLIPVQHIQHKIYHFNHPYMYNPSGNTFTCAINTTIHVHNLFIVPLCPQQAAAPTSPEPGPRQPPGHCLWICLLEGPKWDPTIFVLLCLNYFLQGGRVRFPRYIHVTRSIIPLLRLKDIPLHMYNHLLVMNQCLGEPGHWFQDTPQEQNPWVLKSLIYSGLVFAYNPHHLSSALNHL